MVPSRASSSSAAAASAEALVDVAERQAPRSHPRTARDTELRRALRQRAIDLSEQLLQERWLTASQASTPASTAFLVILVFWMTATSGSFGLFAPRNGTVLVTLCLGAVSAAMYRVVELGTPFEEGIMVSGAPMQRAVTLMAP